MAFPSLRTAFAKFFLVATGAHVPSIRREIFMLIYFSYIILHIISDVLIMN